MTTTTQEQAKPVEPTATRKPKAPRKAAVTRQARRRRPSRPKGANRPTKRTPGQRAKTHKGDGARAGSKSAKILELLRRPDGATLEQLINATGWQAHSVRGFLSAVVGKKLALASAKGEDGAR